MAVLDSRRFFADVADANRRRSFDIWAEDPRNLQQPKIIDADDRNLPDPLPQEQIKKPAPAPAPAPAPPYDPKTDLGIGASPVAIEKFRRGEVGGDESLPHAGLTPPAKPPAAGTKNVLRTQLGKDDPEIVDIVKRKVFVPDEIRRKRTAISDFFNFDTQDKKGSIPGQSGLSWIYDLGVRAKQLFTEPNTPENIAERAEVAALSKRVKRAQDWYRSQQAQKHFTQNPEGFNAAQGGARAALEYYENTIEPYLDPGIFIEPEPFGAPFMGSSGDDTLGGGGVGDDTLMGSAGSIYDRVSSIYNRDYNKPGGGDPLGLAAAVEWVESKNNPDAVSRKNAVGVMQVMPKTLKKPGFGVKPAKNKSTAENRRVGMQYLEAMISRYDSIELGLAAYNWGPGNVDDWLASEGLAGDWPKETSDYVERVLARQEHNKQTDTNYLARVAKLPRSGSGATAYCR